MRCAPVVPPALEAAIVRLAGQYRLSTHINVISEADHLHLRVTVNYGQVVIWSVTDYFYDVAAYERTARHITAARPWELNKKVLLFTWDRDTAALRKRIVSLNDGDSEMTAPVTESPDPQDLTR